MQTVQIDLGPKGADGSPLFLRDKTPVLGLFGLTSSPPVKTDVTVLFLGGERDKGVVIAHGHQTYRVRNLASGDVCLHDAHGNKVVLSAAGITATDLSGNVIATSASGIAVAAASGQSVTVNAPGGSVSVTADHVDITADDVNLGGSGGRGGRARGRSGFGRCDHRRIVQGQGRADMPDITTVWQPAQAFGDYVLVGPDL